MKVTERKRMIGFAIGYELQIQATYLRYLSSIDQLPFFVVTSLDFSYYSTEKLQISVSMTRYMSNLAHDINDGHCSVQKNSASGPTLGTQLD